MYIYTISSIFYLIIFLFSLHYWGQIRLKLKVHLLPVQFELSIRVSFERTLTFFLKKNMLRDLPKRRSTLYASAS